MQLLWKTVWQFLKKLIIEGLYDPARPLLVGIHPRELKTGVQTDKQACSQQRRSKKPSSGTTAKGENNPNAHQPRIIDPENEILPVKRNEVLIDEPQKHYAQ